MTLSNSIISNKYIEKFSTNHLKAETIKSDNISNYVSYLYSVVLNEATLIRDKNNASLIFDINDNNNNNIIKFSDRPFRQTEYISIIDFINLFNSSYIDSFTDIPPNIVIAHNEGQKTYKIVNFSIYNNNMVTFNLELLPNETQNNTTIMVKMNIFVDAKKAKKG